MTAWSVALALRGGHARCRRRRARRLCGDDLERPAANERSDDPLRRSRLAAASSPWLPRGDDGDTPGGAASGDRRHHQPHGGAIAVLAGAARPRRAQSARALQRLLSGAAFVSRTDRAALAQLIALARSQSPRRARSRSSAASRFKARAAACSAALTPRHAGSTRGPTSGSRRAARPTASRRRAFPDFAGRDAAARLPGVRSVELYRGSFLDWGDRRIWVLAPPRRPSRPLAASQLVEGRPRAGKCAAARGTAGSCSHARSPTNTTCESARRSRCPTAQPTRLRVAALSTNLGWPPGAIIMNADDYARAWGSRDPSAYQLELAPTRIGDRRSDSTSGDRTGLGLRVETAIERERRHSPGTQGLSRLTQIRTLVLIAAVLAMAAAMGAMIWQRRASASRT